MVLRYAVCLLWLLFLVPTAAAPQSATLSLQFFPDPPANDIFIGDTTRVSIHVNDPGVTIRAFTFCLTFAPAVVQLGSVLPGTILTSHGYPYFFLDEVVPGIGVDTLKVDAGIAGPSYGPGSLATVDFVGATAGMSPLHFVQWDLCTEVGDSCVSIPTTAVDDTLFVRYPTSADGITLGELKVLFRGTAVELDRGKCKPNTAGG
ncbi:MAG: hypothetical protein KAW17_11795 [Candidatus Eisenbacteria sp.]|nr:hypothetical protein [Candidatus Eisenbacteria bacterium]